MAHAKTMSPALRGIAAMALAAAILTVHDTGTKILLETYSVGQIVAVRQIFSLTVLAVIIQLTSGWVAVRVVNRVAIATRSALFVVTTVLIVASLGVLPIATVLAIVFASPLTVAVLSVPLLGERVGPRRWAAIIVGFVGVLVILRPASPEFNFWLLLPVAAALASGTRDICTRWAGRTDGTMAILFWSNAATVVCGLATLPFVWVAMPFAHYALLFVLALLNTAAHFLMIYALRAGDAALVSPFRYTALVWAVLLGFVVWGDIPDQWTIVGSSIVVISGIYLALREARLAAARRN